MCECLYECVRPVNTTHLYNIYTTSAQRLLRWSNIVQMLYNCSVFTGGGGGVRPMDACVCLLECANQVDASTVFSFIQAGMMAVKSHT